MSFSTQAQENVTVQQPYQGLLENVILSTLTTVPCCVFLFINVTMLFTLRSKSVFRETSRYILLFNLLFADTVLLIQGQVLYLVAAFRERLTYPVCGVLTTFASLAKNASPLTLVVMSLERYVAVCYPLRHATIVSIKNTGVAIIVVWTFSSLNVLIVGFILLNFPFEDLESLQMKHACGMENMLLDPMSAVFDRAYAYFLFVSAGVAVTSSYIGVMIAARSASTDKASAQKARKTLLLHLVQLGLSLSSAIHNPLLIALLTMLDRIIFLRIQIVIYVCIIIFPRCLSSLIYGLRDQSIRPVLMYHLRCQHTHKHILH